MKETCFLISADQKRYSFLFKKLVYGDNVGRYEYPVIVTSTLYLFIPIEIGIRGNHQSNHQNCGDRRGRHPKRRMGNTFVQQRQGGTE